MQFEKRQVRLGDIRPSEQNPREDFGDIGALARSIEATGGEPLNPPVVVADGNVYRIVDGERRYRALSSIYGEDREVSALVADTMDEANELVAMLAFDDEKDIEAVLAAGDGWAGKADSIRRRVEREEAKAEDYDAFGDAGIPVVKEQPEGFTYKDWAHLGLVAAKLEDKEYPAGTVAVWNDRYWDFFAPKGGEDAEPEKTEEEIRAEQEAAREEAALEDMYGRMVDFTADGAFVVCDGIARHVLENRIVPVGLSDTMGEERLQQARDRFMARLGATDPGKYEAGCSLMRIAKNMAQLNSSYCGDDAEGWIEHWNVFRAAGFTPNDEDEWLRARVQESFKEEKDE